MRFILIMGEVSGSLKVRIFDPAQCSHGTSKDEGGRTLTCPLPTNGRTLRKGKTGSKLSWGQMRPQVREESVYEVSHLLPHDVGAVTLCS